MKRIVTAPLGTCEIDVAGSERQAFVSLTVFGDDGWATHEEMWSSHYSDETLASALARVSGLPPSTAQTTAEDFLATYRERGGASDDARMTRHLARGVAGVLLAIAAASVLSTLVVSRWRRGRRGG